MPLVLALLAVAGVTLLGVAGLGFGGPRFRPEWLGLACLALAVTWPILHAASA